MTFPSGLRALNHRDFRIVFAGQSVALVGMWMQQVAQSWLIYDLTGSAFAKLAVPRMHVHQTPLLRDRLYVVGGRDATGQSLGSIEIGTFE